MTELDKLEEPFQNNNIEPNSNNIPVFYQNNNQELNNNNISGPYKNNNPDLYQSNSPGSYHNNISEPYQNNAPVPYQNNVPGPYHDNSYQNNLNQEIVTKNNTMIYLKAICCIIMVIIIVAEIILEFKDLPNVTKLERKDRYDDEANVLPAIYLVLIMPAVNVLSLIILYCSLCDFSPIIKIVIFIILGFLKAYIMLAFFADEKPGINKYGLTLEILNFIFMIIAISLQIILKIKLNLSC